MIQRHAFKFITARQQMLRLSLRPARMTAKRYRRAMRWRRLANRYKAQLARGIDSGGKWPWKEE